MGFRGKKDKLRAAVVVGPLSSPILSLGSFTHLHTQGHCCCEKPVTDAKKEAQLDSDSATGGEGMYTVGHTSNGQVLQGLAQTSGAPVRELHPRVAKTQPN